MINGTGVYPRGKLTTKALDVKAAWVSLITYNRVGVFSVQLGSSEVFGNLIISNQRCKRLREIKDNQKPKLNVIDV